MPPPIGSMRRPSIPSSIKRLTNDFWEYSMRRGELYRVHKPGGGDPKRHRVFVVVSRQVLIDSKFATVTCAPVFSSGEGLATQVQVGPLEGLKHLSWIACDNLVSMRKAELTQYVGALSAAKFRELNDALKLALELR